MTELVLKNLRVEPLGQSHDRTSFTCGTPSLDNYLKTQAGQDVRRRANAVFILTSMDAPSIILGYYTLCAMALDPGDIPLPLQTRLPRYKLVSATLIGRLAIAKSCQGQRYGGALLSDAMQRAYANTATIGSSVIVVDALDETAARFYAANGFVQLPDSTRLILPMHLAASYPR